MKKNAASKPRTFSLHWGAGTIAEEAVALDKYHRSVIQLLKFEQGAAAGTYEIRFCYYDTDGRFQRSPLIVDEENLAGLAEALKSTPRLRRMLKRLTD